MAKEPQTPDSWVIVQWVTWHDLRLVGLVEKDGKPRTDCGLNSDHGSFYKWNSYRAAKKFLDAHPNLAGSFILNLSEAIRSHRAIDERKHKSGLLRLVR